MKTVEQLRNVAQDLIGSYDARVDAVGTIIDNTYQILDDFKEKRTKLSTELRETLAKRESLRKKDFDRMMNGILLNHEEKEKEIKQDLRNFLTEQKKEAHELKDALMKGEVERMKKAQMGIERGIAEVKGLLKGFYQEQEGLANELRKLLTKGKDLKIKDLKDMTRNLQTLTGTEEVKRMGLHDVATDIRALGQDMASSHVDRTASIDALKKETDAMMKAYQQANMQREKEVREMLANFQNENAERQEEVRDLFKSVHKFMGGVQSENDQRRVEVSNLMDHFQKENAKREKEVKRLLASFREDMKAVHKEVMALAAATKEMWSTVAGVKGGAKKARARSYAQAEPKKPAKRAKGKAKKYRAS